MLAYITSSANPIRKVIHFYNSLEHQGRGMSHWNGLYWVENAPLYGISFNQEVADFILKYLSCRIPDKNISLELYRRVMSYQQHKDNNYCMRQVGTSTGNQKACRFGFP